MVNRPIILTDYGLGSSYANFIELNVKLEKVPKLKEAILHHEKRHNTQGYNWKDFKNDFMSKQSYFKESLMFSIHNPECLVGWFPAMYSYYAKEWTYNTSAIMPFIYFGLIFTVFFKLAVKLPFTYSIPGYFALIAILNLITLGIAHAHVKDITKKGELHY